LLVILLAVLLVILLTLLMIKLLLLMPNYRLFALFLFDFQQGV
jgi:hypothetical protein